jgi:H+/Cl- antiporter ClcA
MIFGKILLTGFTLGAGFKGGEVTLFFIGATLERTVPYSSSQLPY